MKKNISNILCLIISVFMLVSMVQVSVFATEPATRTFYVEASDNEVFAGDEVIINVRVDGERIYGAQWTLEYDADKFELVENESSELSSYQIQIKNEPIAATDILATYKFVALAHSKKVDGDFTVVDAVAQTRLEAANHEIVTPVIEKSNVVIMLKDGLETQITIDGDLVYGDTCAIPYVEEGYKIGFKAVIDDVPTDEANIKVYVDDVEMSSDGFTLKDVKSYVIKCVTTKDGYITDERTYTLNIKEATFKYEVKFDGTTVDSASKEIVYDGDEHFVTITSDPTTTIAVTVNTVPTDVDDLKFKAVDEYVIEYTIAKEGYTTVNGTYTLNITNATFDLVEVKVDDIAVSDGEVKEIEYNGAEHSITVNSEPVADIVVKVDGVITPVEELKYTAVGEYVVEYEITKEGYATKSGSFTLKITVPDYAVEVNLGTENADYVSGKKIVLVYTNSDAISFTYGEDVLPMYDVTSKGYKYIGTADFEQTADTNVYAVVVNYIENGSLSDYESKVKVVYSEISDDYVVPKPVEGLECDLNNSNAIEMGDVIASYATYHGDEDYYPELMALVLKADVNNDKHVYGDDTKACATAFKETRNNE